MLDESCTVLIGAADLLPALRERTGGVNGEVLAFSESEALRALETITTRRPKIIVLERLFSVSPRGTALIRRIKDELAALLARDGFSTVTEAIGVDV